jgi:hypothetical protein
MAQVYRLYPDTAVTEALTAAVNNAFTSSAEIDNSTEKWTGMWCHLNADFTAALNTLERFIQVAIGNKKPDGTNTEDATPQVYQQNIVATLKCGTGGTTVNWAFHIPKLPPTKFVLSFGNFSGSNMDTTCELRYVLYTTELAAA